MTLSYLIQAMLWFAAGAVFGRLSGEIIRSLRRSR